jgi:hypothetical protein
MAARKDHLNASCGISRRAMLRHATGGAGATALLAAALPVRAQTKIAVATAGYQDSGQNGQTCAACTHFIAPSSCKLVEGTISPQGWCKLFAQKG